MKKDVVIVDVTRANTATESSILNNLMEETAVAAEDLVVLALPKQVPPVTAACSGARVVPIGALAPEAEVVQFLTRQPVDLPVGTERAFVFSFHRSVLDIAAEDPQRGIHYVLQPLGRFTSRSAKPPSAWPEGLMPIDEAVVALVGALRRAPSRGVYKTAVRPMLAMEDARFDKATSPLSRTPGLVSLIVNEAVRRGLVRTIGDEPGMMLSLVDGGPALAAASVHVAPLPEIPAPDRPIAQPRSVSGGYIDVLRSHGYGYSDMRHRLYDDFEAQVKENPGLPLSVIVDRAWSATREGASQGAYAWKGLRECFQKLLMRCPVALDEGDAPVRPNFADAGRGVAALRPEWRELLDGELVVVLVENGVRLSADSVRDLAGALLLRRDEEAQRFARRTVELLLESGRLVEGDDADGYLALT